MGRRNYVIEGVSGTGKTSLCTELIRRGYHAVHGDRELRPDASPQRSGEVVSNDDEQRALMVHRHAFWDEAKVRRHLDNHDADLTFFCGGFRNHGQLLGLFDGVFILEIDRETLLRRLDLRPEDEFGGRPAERKLIVRLHETKEDMPKSGIIIDGTQPLEVVADVVIGYCRAIPNRQSNTGSD